MNIVFDLGGVVFDWQPDKIIRSVFDDVERQQLVRDEIFRHPDWVELDRGTLSREHAIDRGTIRTKMPRSDISKLFDQIPQALAPIVDSIDLLYSIKDTDNRLYILSNMHLASIEYLESKNSIWGLFDGMVISCRVKKVKPEKDIYEYLLKEFKLVANETIFIDDMDANLQVASNLGIKTIQFVSPSQCRNELVELKCI